MYRETLYYNTNINRFSSIKQPDEVFNIKIDFDDYLDTAEVLSDADCSATAIDESGTEYATLLGTPVWEDKYASIPVQNGVSGTVYYIKVKAKSDAGNIFEMDIRLKVLEIGT